MKKLLLMALVSILCISTLIVFTISGCKAEEESSSVAEEAEEEIAEEVTEEDSVEEEAVVEEDVIEIEGMTIGYIGMDMKLSYFQSQTLVLRRIGEREGFEVIMLDPQFDTQAYIDQAETLITQQVDGVLLSVWEPGLGASSVQVIQKAGIPIVVMHVPAAESVTVPTVVADNYYAGQLAGREAARIWQEENADVIPVIAISTSTDAPENVKRTTGQLDGFRETYPDAELVKTVDGGYDLESSLAAAEDILTANPEVNIIFTAHDTQAMGALGAFKGAGRGIWPDALVSSVDATRQSADEIKKPDSAFRISVGNSPLTMTETSWEILKGVIMGEDVEMFSMHDMELVNVDNIDEYLDENFPVEE